jgi:uncharacterized protein
MTSIEDIRNFLGLRRLAVVGVSRNPRDFTRSLFRELLARGYDVVPVHPAATEIEGLPCVPSIAAVSPAPEGVLLLTPPGVSAVVVRECAAAGVASVWMYRAAGAGAVSAEAAAWCRSSGIRVVEGECPFMFLPDTAWFHRLHGVCRKLVGSYPG